MIKRLRVENFRSLKELDLRPGLTNVLVGPNAAGKSNIVDVLKFLTDVASQGLGRALTNRQGYHEVVWKGKDTGPIRIALEAEIHLGPGKLRQAEYEIEVDGTATGAFWVPRERLAFSGNGPKTDVVDLRMGKGEVCLADRKTAFEAPAAGASRSALEYSIPGWEGTFFKQHLGAWQFHRLDPLTMKQLNPASRADVLIERGDNLGAWLATLKTSHAEHFRRIEQVAQDAVPGLLELVTELTANQMTFLSSREEHLARPVPVWGLADGELCFIALASLILAPPELGAPLHCAEEIENHLHPRLLATLIELLKQEQTRCLESPGAAQVFTTTHSPYLVDQFALDELVVVDKVEGQTRCARASDKAHLRELLEREELGLGELWYSGALGGV
jgi:predicted ATPase